MSLEGTHIRFALDLQKEYKIEDINKYIAGSIYPDSRYVSGINRESTHHDKYILPEFATDDFKKGWRSHQICDRAFNLARKKLFPDLFPPNYDFYAIEDWIIITAMKIIQDMNDIQLFDIKIYLPCLGYAFNPNNENIEIIKKYNHIMIDLYSGDAISVENYINMWLALGPEAVLCNKVRAKTEEYLQNPEIVIRIKSIYQEMLNTYPSILIEKKFSLG